MNLVLFLYDIQSPINIGLILRAAEQFQDSVAMYDPRNVLNDAEKKKTISDFACGALTRKPPLTVQNFDEYRKTHKGRIIATSLSEKAIPLNQFKFEEGDTILFGNEYDGLPADIIASADLELYIPLPEANLPKPKSFSPIDTARTQDVNQNGVPNLNVSTAVAIIAYAQRAQRLASAMDEILEGEQPQNKSEQKSA